MVGLVGPMKNSKIDENLEKEIIKIPRAADLGRSAPHFDHHFLDRFLGGFLSTTLFSEDSFC